MSRKAKRTSDAIKILHHRYYEGRPKRVAQLEEDRASDEVARKLLDIRAKAGLTQTELADLVGTTSSVISRLEDSRYKGHSLSMLRRVAAALNKRVDIRFISARSGRIHAA